MIDVKMSLTGAQLAAAVNDDDQEMARFLAALAETGIARGVASDLGPSEIAAVRNMLLTFIDELDKVVS